MVSPTPDTPGILADTPPDFRHVETWIFDLDNTLYAADTHVFQQVSDRMRAFIARELSLPEDEAHRLQKLYYREYGTTLNGLMHVHKMEPDPFLDFVHDIDLGPLGPDARLGRALARLPGRKFVHTNGTLGHAENVLARLEVAHHFEDIFDIKAGGYVPKPEAQPYEMLLARAGYTANRAAMFEDIPRNLETPHALGMTTVLVHTAFEDEVAADMGAQDPATLEAVPGGAGLLHVPEYIHHLTDDLVTFLEALTLTPQPPSPA